MLELVGVKQIFAEAVAEIDGDVFHLTFTFAVFLEVVIDTNPFLVVSGKVLMVVGKEVLLRGVSVDEAKVASEDGEFSLGADAFGCYQFLFVEFTIFCCARLANEVDAKVFSA